MKKRKLPVPDVVTKRVKKKNTVFNAGHRFKTNAWMSLGKFTKAAEKKTSHMRLFAPLVAIRPSFIIMDW
jgi:hypothetical protein